MPWMPAQCTRVIGYILFNRCLAPPANTRPPYRKDNRRCDSTTSSSDVTNPRAELLRSKQVAGFSRQWIRSVGLATSSRQASSKVHVGHGDWYGTLPACLRPRCLVQILSTCYTDYLTPCLYSVITMTGSRMSVCNELRWRRATTVCGLVQSKGQTASLPACAQWVCLAILCEVIHQNSANSPVAADSRNLNLAHPLLAHIHMQPGKLNETVWTVPTLDPLWGGYGGVIEGWLSKARKDELQ